MNKTLLAIGIVSLALAAVIFVFAEGARRIYSGAFFTIIGVVTVLNAKRGSLRVKRNDD
ncbi:MAG: hypothetical protein PVJ43_12170 [Gemmatimonadales bacterium]|jgi:hypothetical protein